MRTVEENCVDARIADLLATKQMKIFDAHILRDPSDDNDSSASVVICVISAKFFLQKVSSNKIPQGLFLSKNVGSNAFLEREKRKSGHDRLCQSSGQSKKRYK